MPKQVQTTQFIPAPLDQVWRALSDFDAYPRWNSLLRLRPLSGLREGGRALLTLRVGKLPLVVPVVVEAASGTELRWVGGNSFRPPHAHVDSAAAPPASPSARVRVGCADANHSGGAGLGSRTQVGPPKGGLSRSGDCRSRTIAVDHLSASGRA
jgi:hypothetical protein